jgi:SRR1
MSADQDEWTTVTVKKGTRRTTNKVKSRRTNSKGGVSQKNLLNAINSVNDASTLLDIISQCKDQLLTSDLWTSFDQQYQDMDCTRSIEQVICYGIGNYSQTPKSHFAASVWQLAFALCLRETQETISVIHFFDPCTTELEASVLAQLDISVITENEQGRRCIGSTPTLFFMPHCPRTLYENVAWANFESLQVKTPLVVIGNSIRCICESLTHLSERRCLQAWLPCMQEWPLTVSALDKRDCTGNILGAFNDTYLMWWAVSDNDDEVEMPVRPYEEGADCSEDLELL